MRYSCEDDREQDKKLKKFRFYSMEEEDEERFNGVCTKLKLFDDPWIIKKVLEKSDVNESCRLMISRRLVQEHIVNVWERAGRDGDVTSLREGIDVGVNVWDCNRGKEYVLTLKMHRSTKCYVFLGNWSRQFVIERGLKKGDEIGLFWCNSSSRFFFSVLALAPHHPLCYLEGF
ncbi:B3 domain-containing protein [Heracleum sosnowskyi]|uniref:B3 domain-containing protein n=1 Tax=Heracleum sosnowskyi TaxID=360622 RepID=A0AAD8MS04_9APIA|nr:B3 domain-containing protein [Heracleum sosnowskyi]KAK1387227.1 B3 domain-containing protein [Heracleum sosnowskyi]